MDKKKNEITIRSSAAEYLTYVAAVGDNPESIEVRYEDENIWLTRKMLATLYNVNVAPNYLSEKEIGQLERIVSAYLDLAEMQAMRHIPMTMADWEERLNGFLKLWDHEILKDNGKISAEMAKLHAETEFERYRIIQDRIYVSDFDELLLNAKKLNKNETQ